jgi:hypothetical protein
MTERSKFPASAIATKAVADVFWGRPEKEAAAAK